MQDTTLPSPSNPLLRVDGLCTTFMTDASKVRVVENVSLELDPKECLGIVGESGSGKSVLVRSIMGLVPSGTTAVVSGRVLLEDVDLTQLPAGERRRLWGQRIAMVLQDPLTSLNPVKRVGDQIGETIRRHNPRLRRRDVRKRSTDLLRSVGIPAPERRLRDYPHQLSGGMRQRVGIAIALSGTPKVLLADEPTTALDVTVQHQILDLLQQKQKEIGMGMILVTHDLGVIANRADRVVVMYSGRVVETAPTESLFKSVRMPYTKALLDALPKLDQPSHSRLAAIPGNPPDLATPPSGCRFAPRCPIARPRCHQEEPELRQSVEPEHWYRCWYPLGASDEASGAGPVPMEERV